MKYCCLLIMLSGMFSLIISQTDENVDNQTLDDVVVKETYEAGFEEEKLPVFINADFTNIVEIKERINWSAVDWKGGESNLSTSLFELHYSAPELVGIKPPPARAFQVNFEELASWKLDIFTSDGKLFRGLGREGSPPAQITWDGRSDTGEPLIPGEQYAYSFTATDKAGNRRTFPGEGFSIKALYLTEENTVWIGIATDELFSPDGFGLTQHAAEYSRELTNLIYYYGNIGLIKISSDHPETEKFLELLTEDLGAEVKFIRREPSGANQQSSFSMWIE
jgi:hypothetical protein